MSGELVGVPRAVLDANVIFSRVLHELIGRVASGARLLDLVWSDELTVKLHVKHILRKLRASNRAEAVSKYFRLSFRADGQGDAEPS